VIQRAHCVAVRMKAQGPGSEGAPPIEARRWTSDEAQAQAWHAATPGSKLASFTAEQAAQLPPKLKAEAFAHLPE
jgi:hypothetical protein